MTTTRYGVSLDEFVSDYIAAALFSSNDESTPEGGEPLDSNYGIEDIAPSAMDRIRKDCKKFLDDKNGGGMIVAAIERQEKGEWGHTPGSPDDTITEHAGRDFWYTRAGHGCGFWDGDWPQDLGDAMNKLAESFGECYFYVGDDGKLYVD